MKRLALKGSGRRPALTVAARGARLTAVTPHRPSHCGPRLGAAGLFALGLLGLGGCVADIPDSNPGEGVVALFNPGASPPVVPAPTDLVRVGGMLQIPVDPAEATNGALATFNNYLRGLDGFPPDSAASTSFSAAVDSTSLTEGVVVYDATAQVLLTAPDVVPTLDSTGKQLSLGNTARWHNGHTYFVGLLSWQDSAGVHGLRGSDAKRVIADSAFALLRSTTPLYAKCQDPTSAACACPDLTSADCHAVVDGVTSAQAQQLEVGRLGMKPLIDAVLTLKSRTRSDLVMAFSFTISQHPFAAFDITRNQIPFPSNLLLANHGFGDPQADSLVNVPILPTDDARTQALKGGLNTLDGFSTTGSVQFPVDTVTSNGLPVDIDAATLTSVPTGGKPPTAYLVNFTVPAKQPSFTGAPLHALLDATKNISGFAGQVWLTPSSPLLGDRTLYASVLTTSVKDKNGQALVPAPVTLLITQSSPLVTADGQSAVPTIPLAQAQQLEPLRLALAPVVAQFKVLGVAPSSIAALTVYRTQSIVKPIQKLLGATAQLAPVIPSTVTITSMVTPPAPLSAAIGTVVHGTMTIRRAVDLRGTINLGRLTADPANNDTIPFMLTLPIAGLTPAAGAAVVIAQHGLTRWRGDTLGIATTLASKGLAMIAIDAIYHGGRVVCLSNADCASGVTCNQPGPPVNGVPQAGKCAGVYLAASGATPTLPGSTDLFPDPALPGRDFNNLANPFAQRDNFRQATLDLFQLVRVIKDGTAGGLAMQVAAQGKIDPTKIGYFGQSLGSFLGVNFLALSPSVNLGVLNVGGGDLVDLYTDPASALSAGVATALGVVPGSPAFFSLKENFRWIFDPADPINFARFVRAPDPTLTPGRTAAKVILQEAGMDLVIPNKYTLALGKELGLPMDASGMLGISQEGGASPTNVSTFFPTAGHGAVFDFIDMALTLKIQLQAATYLVTGLGATPPTVL